MTPEQDDLVEHVAWLHREAEDCADLEGMGLYCQRLTKAAELITQLQEQVTELENHNKDKSQLLANYKEQIKKLVKQKYRGEK